MEGDEIEARAVREHHRIMKNADIFGKWGVLAGTLIVWAIVQWVDPRTGVFTWLIACVIGAGVGYYALRLTYLWIAARNLQRNLGRNRQ